MPGCDTRHGSGICTSPGLRSKQYMRLRLCRRSRGCLQECSAGHAVLLLPCSIEFPFVWDYLHRRNCPCDRIAFLLRDRELLVQHGVHIVIPIARAPRFACCDSRSYFASRLLPGPFDRAHDPIASRCRQWYKFPRSALEREAVLVISAGRVWPQRRDPDAIFNFCCLCAPLIGRAVGFGRHPSFDVPAIHGKIFRDAAQPDRFADHIAARVAVCPAPTNPCESRPAPYNAELRLTITVRAADTRYALLNCGRRLMRFSCNLNQGRMGSWGHAVACPHGEHLVPCWDGQVVDECARTRRFVPHLKSREKEKNVRGGEPAAGPVNWEHSLPADIVEI